MNSEPGEVSVRARPAPELHLLTLPDGRTIQNDGLRGKVVLVDFWSSWCPPCRAEAAGLAAVYREYDGAEVEFVGVAIWDETGDVLRHLERYDVGYPNGLDAKGIRAVEFGVRGVPEKFFLDREGTIIRKLTGPIPPERLRQVLDELLAS